MKNKLFELYDGALGIIMGIISVIYGAFTVVIGAWGMYEFMGFWPAVIITGISLALHFSLPFSAGVFYYAWKVWDLHWVIAALIAAPGVLFFLAILSLAFLDEK